MQPVPDQTSARRSAPITVGDPNEIGGHAFEVRRKGYDQDEVRTYLNAVADALADAQRREADMRSRLAKAVRRAEDALAKAEAVSASDYTEKLGDEVSRVLDATRMAAEERTARSVAEANAIVERARAEATDIKKEAQGVLGVRTKEAETAARSIIDAADTAAGERTQEAELALNNAREAGLEHLNRAEQEAASLVEQAEKARVQILRDMDRRRRTMRAQVEQLKAARDRLLESHDVMRELLDGASKELRHSLIDAKVKGESASRRVGEVRFATPDELEAEVSDAAMIGSIQLPGLVFRDDLDHEEILGGLPTSAKPEKTDEPAGAATAAKPVVRLDKRGPEPAAKAGSKSVDSAKAAPAKAADAKVGSKSVDSAKAAPAKEAEAKAGSKSVDSAKVAPAKAAEAKPGSKSVDSAKAAPARAAAAKAALDKPAIASGPATASAAPSKPDTARPNTAKAAKAAASGSKTAPTDAGSATPAKSKKQAKTVGQAAPVVAHPSAGAAARAAAARGEQAELSEALLAPEEQDDNDLPLSAIGKEPVAATPPPAAASIFERLRSGSGSDEPIADTAPPAGERVKQPETSEKSATASATDAVSTKPSKAKKGSKSKTAKTDKSDKAGSSGTPVAAAAADANEINGDDEQTIGPDEVAGSNPLVAVRDSAVSDLEPRVARGLKRVMADEQNVMLETAEMEFSGPLLDVLPDREHHADLFLDAVMGPLGEAWAAGAAFIDESAAVKPPKRTEFEAAVNNLVIGPIRERLATVDPSKDAEAATAALRGFYRQHKVENLNAAASYLTLFAFSGGSLAAAGATDLQWVHVEHEAGCPDGRDNELGGPLKAGSMYPSGCQSPPIGPGCRCLLIQPQR